MSRLPEEYPSAPGYKVAGPSQEAAEAIAPVAGAKRAEVFRVIRETPGGVTADEISKILNWSILTVRPRVSELHRDGEIHSTGERRKNDNGMSATVWGVAPPPAWSR